MMCSRTHCAPSHHQLNQATIFPDVFEVITQELSRPGVWVMNDSSQFVATPYARFGGSKKRRHQRMAFST